MPVVAATADGWVPYLGGRPRRRPLGGAKWGATAGSFQATPGHGQPPSTQLDPTSSYVRPPPGTHRRCLLSSGSRVRILPGALTCGNTSLGSLAAPLQRSRSRIQRFRLRSGQGTGRSPPARYEVISPSEAWFRTRRACGPRHAVGCLAGRRAWFPCPATADRQATPGGPHSPESHPGEADMHGQVPDPRSLIAGADPSARRTPLFANTLRHNVTRSAACRPSRRAAR